VRLSIDERQVRLEIEDDGMGFDPEEARRRAARGASAGLVGMRERVLLVGGQLDIDSWPSSGTYIRAVIPLDRRTAS
jgi:signal transduction histidine kinase